MSPPSTQSNRVEGVVYLGAKKNAQSMTCSLGYKIRNHTIMQTIDGAVTTSSNITVAYMLHGSVTCAVQVSLNVSSSPS